MPALGHGVVGISDDLQQRSRRHRGGYEVREKLLDMAAEELEATATISCCRRSASG